MGQITVEKNVGNIEGLCIITPAVHGDDRGFLWRPIISGIWKKPVFILISSRIISLCRLKASCEAFTFKNTSPVQISSRRSGQRL